MDEYDYHFIKKSNQPQLIELEDGVTIKIDSNKNILIEGQNGIKFKCIGDIDFDADTINMHAKTMTMSVDGDVYMGSSTHIIQQAPRIDFNPNVLSSGYYGNIKKKVLDMFKFTKSSGRFNCEEIKDDKG